MPLGIRANLCVYIYRFGGLVYLSAASSDAAAVSVEVGGCAAAPRATAGAGLEADGPAPWGEAEGERVVLTVPRAALIAGRDAVARAGAPPPPPPLGRPPPAPSPLPVILISLHLISLCIPCVAPAVAMQVVRLVRRSRRVGVSRL